MAGTFKRWFVWVLLGILALSLVVGTAFAGGSSGGGLHNGGNHYGNDNKKDTYNCTDKYSWDYTYNYSGSWAYDLNDDGVICVKWVDGEYHFVDDISGH